MDHCDAPSAEGVSPDNGAALNRGFLRPRLLAFVVIIGLVTPLLVARTLSPSTHGLGTHQQLGLPPCSMRVLFGIRCPACGMTTSWSHWTRGDWWASLRTNAGGACLAFVAVGIVAIAAKVLWTGRVPEYPTTYRIGWAIVAVGGITVIDWFVRLSQ
ncbi:DUF2752 domain-containing protein [Rhodopirellula sallentina]|uniref:Putative membrane protein n=1 Tax=Rhodopirellula sallentina SM41 TaxID=1263870 RepID=M5U8P2_9BACT|nr:DUF2752 domain-containing protein [Rhodopirellula sallentina]EMI57842.1 putative membrane protein [Rhodopirellula sallentina SM41]